MKIIIWGQKVGIGRVADRIGQSVEHITDGVSEALFEPVIRLGVTGLARSGKTVFITSLIANLLDRGRMQAMHAVRSGRIEAAYLQRGRDDAIPRFDYETHLHHLTSAAPVWPASTAGLSEIKLSFRVRPYGLLAGLSKSRIVHLEIVDYPGEWVLDLGLFDLNYTTWSARALAQANTRPEGAAYMAALASVDADAKFDDAQAARLARLWRDYLMAARDAGYYDCTPGRFLLPGDMEGSPALTFAPLPPSDAPRGSLAREFSRRFGAYKSRVVVPFFRNHFSRIDRQIVLVDALGAIHSGPRATQDLRQALSAILAAFRPGKNAILQKLLGRRRIDRILFAATKADHLHHSQHDRLGAILSALLDDARRRADFEGAKTQAMAIASLRSTIEETRDVNGAPLHLVCGNLLDTGQPAALHPGDLPTDPSVLIGPAQNGAENWLGHDFDVMRFAPAPLSLRPGDGPPHIRLDHAAEFLIGDKL
jgi:predicted YcjX-like family ATPase